ncbi:FAD-dependent oxidoreductase [Breznakiella homolactica]|uniref:FAD-dependent oxidoreductase n=1 Tax=Breznakiella homolactica TaxID=2798577 RepID=A0A7T7XPM3_9SPIR|nr:FAD-dependent oxidoreductase [Breznakiella homolactica]QQO10137.1 FAD-dependent oxidoreductase [Breznakiella homolactica]
MSERLVVIGGTAAGLSAASKAKRSYPDLAVTVFEKTGYTSYGSCGLPYFIGGIIQNPGDLVTLTPEALRTERGIETFIRHEALSIDRNAKTVTVKNLEDQTIRLVSYDYLVIATGAYPVMPSIPGIDSTGVFHLRSVEDGIAFKAKAGVSKEALIIGGGLIGLEVAEQLSLKGLSVTVLEAAPRILPHLADELAADVTAEMEKHGVAIRCSAQVTEVLRENGEAKGVRTGDGEIYRADCILVSVGVRPNSSLAADAGIETGFLDGIAVDRYMKTSDPSVWACGDCVEMRNLITGEPVYVPAGTTANKQGRIAGSNIAGENAEFKGVLGSQVTKLFGLTVASAGLTEDQARKAGFAPVSSMITKSDRASYYPGSRDAKLRLTFDENTGVLLAAQGAGSESIAGRINVLVAAITAGMTVMQLEELDLVYAPPVAPVYDPILIAASQGIKLVKPKQ